MRKHVGYLSNLSRVSDLFSKLFFRCITEKHYILFVTTQHMKHYIVVTSVQCCVISHGYTRLYLVQGFIQIFLLVVYSTVLSPKLDCIRKNIPRKNYSKSLCKLLLWNPTPPTLHPLSIKGHAVRGDKKRQIISFCTTPTSLIFQPNIQ